MSRRPPIIHTELTIKFRSHEQAVRLVQKLAAKRNIAFSYEEAWLDDVTEFHVHIPDLSWGENVEWLGRYLKKIDYRMD